MTIQARTLSATQASRLAKARAVTEAQLEMAAEIAKRYKIGDEMVGVILQALAANYAATVDAAKD